MLVYGLLGLSAAFLIWHDVRKQTIPLWGLGVFALSAILKQSQDPQGEGIWSAAIIATVFWGCQRLFYYFKRAPAMGPADLILGPLCGLWVSLHELSSFFITTGLVALMLGVFWYYWWGMRTFPMVPAILTGLGSVFLIRCFSSICAL